MTEEQRNQKRIIELYANEFIDKLHLFLQREFCINSEIKIVKNVFCLCIKIYIKESAAFIELKADYFFDIDYKIKNQCRNKYVVLKECVMKSLLNLNKPD